MIDDVEAPLPPDKADVMRADWQLMEDIQRMLSQALQKYLEGRVKKKLGGVDLTTMFMSLHNWHKVMLVNMAAQIAPTNPLGRVEFFKNARDTFVKGVNDMIIQLEGDNLKSAIQESEQRRVRKERPN